MPGILSDQSQRCWCFECHCETRHESHDLLPTSDGQPRRARACVDCGATTATTIEVSEVEYHRLLRADRQLQEARRALRQIVDAVLSGGELPAPFRRTESLPR